MVAYRVCGTLIGCIGLTFATIGCERNAGNPAKDSGAERLIRTLENPRLAVKDRVLAAKQLGETLRAGDDGVADAVDRMLALLPGDLDVVTQEIVFSLGDIGDRRAIPVLKRLQDSGDIPSKLNNAIIITLNKLSNDGPT